MTFDEISTEIRDTMTSQKMQEYIKLCRKFAKPCATFPEISFSKMNHSFASLAEAICCRHVDCIVPQLLVLVCTRWPTDVFFWNANDASNFFLRNEEQVREDCLRAPKRKFRNSTRSYPSLRKEHRASSNDLSLVQMNMHGNLELFVLSCRNFKRQEGNTLRVS